MRDETYPLMALYQHVNQTRLVNLAMGTHLTPDEVCALPLDLVAMAVATVTQQKDG